MKFAIARGAWKSIIANDLTNVSTRSLFHAYRDNEGLRSLIRGISESVREELKTISPALIGDYYFDRKDFLSAVPLFLRSNDLAKAINSTERVLASKNADDTLGLVDVWKQNRDKSATIKNHKISKLLELFDSPTLAAKSKNCREYVKYFGHDVVIRQCQM